jgi:hypothetical protein
MSVLDDIRVVLKFTLHATDYGAHRGKRSLYIMFYAGGKRTKIFEPTPLL